MLKVLDGDYEYAEASVWTGESDCITFCIDGDYAVVQTSINSFYSSGPNRTAMITQVQADDLIRRYTLGTKAVLGEHEVLNAKIAHDLYVLLCQWRGCEPVKVLQEVA